MAKIRTLHDLIRVSFGLDRNNIKSLRYCNVHIIIVYFMHFSVLILKVKLHVAVLAKSFHCLHTTDRCMRPRNEKNVLFCGRIT